MAAKLESEVSERLASKEGRLIKVASQNENLDHSSELSEFCKEQEDFADLAKGCQKVLFYMMSALNEAEPVNMLCSLKNARDIASKSIDHTRDMLPLSFIPTKRRHEVGFNDYKSSYHPTTMPRSLEKSTYNTLGAN